MPTQVVRSGAHAAQAGARARAIQTRARFDGIPYANCWEDADVLVRALEPLEGARCLSVASAGDKKASIQAFQYVRGKMVTAEIELPREVVEQDLRTTPEAMERYWKGAFVAAAHAGTIGGQGQFANGMAALFLACGRDVACVAEAAVGTTRLELTEAGDLYASVYLPNLICGTVGGGASAARSGPG